MSHREVARVLEGTASFDELNGKEQAVVRQEWADRMAALQSTLDYASQFSADGESYSELDEHGNVVIHPTG